MNKIEAFVTNIQKQVLDAMGYVGGCSSRLIRIDGEFDPQEAIRAYLTALSSSPVSELVERLQKIAGPVRMENGSFSDIAYEAATAITALSAKVAEMEAENARLRAELDEATVYARNLLTAFVGEHFPDNDRWQPLGDLAGMLTQIDNASTIAREYKARLAEALKALEPFAKAADERRPKGISGSVCFSQEVLLAAHRVREGGKVDG